jgi:23S rRNA (cytidine1920-2'-O)/16S rRNA (cytidine1409-2'-O)-methyltransferase
MAERKRADLLLVERGLFDSRARAQAAIEAGSVTADGEAVTKPSQQISGDALLDALPAHPWVSRGGVKLAGALERYPIHIEDRVCIDVGASTGGFTEVLLANGAALVYAIDVGRGQLHPSLQGHAKIVSREATDIRSLSGTRLDIRPDLVTIDVSFISLKLVLPAGSLGGTDRYSRADQAAVRSGAKAPEERHRARRRRASRGV